MKNVNKLIEEIKRGDRYPSEISRLTGYSRERVRQMAEALGVVLPKNKRGRVTIVCKNCKKTLRVPFNRTEYIEYIKKGYCSRECFLDARSLYLTLKCPCGITFKRKKSKVRWWKERGNKHCYHSRECFLKYWERNRTGN